MPGSLGKAGCMSSHANKLCFSFDEAPHIFFSNPFSEVQLCRALFTKFLTWKKQQLCQECSPSRLHIRRIWSFPAEPQWVFQGLFMEGSSAPTPRAVLLKMCMMYNMKVTHLWGIQPNPASSQAAIWWWTKVMLRLLCPTESSSGPHPLPVLLRLETWSWMQNLHMSWNHNR